jgi:hypothetical protein
MHYRWHTWERPQYAEVNISVSLFTVFVRTIFRLTQRRFLNRLKTLGRTLSDEWSARRKGLYLHTTTQHRHKNKHPCLERDSNPWSQRPRDEGLRLRPRGHWEMVNMFFLLIFMVHSCVTSRQTNGRRSGTGVGFPAIPSFPQLLSIHQSPSHEVDDRPEGASHYDTLRLTLGASSLWLSIWLVLE